MTVHVVKRNGIVDLKWLYM